MDAVLTIVSLVPGTILLGLPSAAFGWLLRPGRSVALAGIGLGLAVATSLACYYGTRNADGGFGVAVLMGFIGSTTDFAAAAFLRRRLSRGGTASLG